MSTGTQRTGTRRSAAPGRGGGATELRRMARLATPIVLTQIAWVAMLTTDTAMIGRLGAEQLAGTSLGQMVFFLCWTFCNGDRHHPNQGGRHPPRAANLATFAGAAPRKWR